MSKIFPAVDLQQIINYDELQNRCKSQKDCKNTKKAYMRSVALIDTKLVKIKATSEKRLQQIEKLKFTENGFQTASLEDIKKDPIMVELYNTIKIINAIRKNF